MRQLKLRTGMGIGNRFGKHSAAFQLALVLSFAGSNSSLAQSGLPELPKLPGYPIQVSAPCQSLPVAYPFETRQESRDRTTGRLISMLGFRTQAQTFQHSVADEPTPPTFPVAAAVLDSPAFVTPAILPPEVVQAAAESDESFVAEEVDCVVERVVPALETINQESSLSLIDIDVPLEDNGPTNPPQPLPIRSKNADDENAGVALELMALPTPSSRVPTIVSDTKTLSLRVEAPRLSYEKDVHESSQRRREVASEGKTSIIDALEPAAFSFSDSKEGQAQSSRSENVATNFSDKQGESREASLHLSSASSQPTSLPSQPTAPKAMQVRIEGEPAVVVSKSAVSKSAVPKTTQQMNLKPAETVPAVASTQPQKIRASLASLVSDVDPQQPQEPQPKTEDLKYGPPIPVRIQDATTMVLDSNIVELSIEHPRVCQLIQSGNRTISLVGLQSGATRIAMVTTSDAGERLVEIREITVTGQNTAQADGRTLAEDISVMVRKLYPTSDVQVVSRDGNLIVQGFTESEANAKKILAFVRKTSLTPVIDRLVSDER